VKYGRDVTEEVNTRKEKDRLEQYFQTVIKNLPGGVAVVSFRKGGRMTPEFLSDGFAAMTGMTLEDAWRMYRHDAMAGVMRRQGLGKTMRWPPFMGERNGATAS
jgi:hypothetical protein